MRWAGIPETHPKSGGFGDPGFAMRLVDNTDRTTAKRRSGHSGTDDEIIVVCYQRPFCRRLIIIHHALFNAPEALLLQDFL